MTRTTPPRTVDITELFTELREHSATATRLHPRPGTPTGADSSVGGPLLWPADEPWPVCTDGDSHYVFELRTPASVRRSREVYAAAEARSAANGTRYALTDEEQAHVPAYDFSEPEDLVERPAVPVSLAEHLHLGVGLVDVDGDVVELLDELLDVLRLELGEVDRYP
ncbi:hypothetical protein SAMN05443287_1246 [Micromonospora phaseoli]|uniref:Uncharacterized protein n=1 Tax=Micromonospora phaseoli TaxID=1144548 RepID=A0A1H7E0D9_9ACTN|nr:hypothetical protein CLV64_103550 [Micromonospora phaseoli]SEK07134.1 hypothetical protein SAMN05443287_1246 [Micromonospora phaseoli]